MSAELVIDGLRASVGGVEVLRGVDLVVRSGEVQPDDLTCVVVKRHGTP